VGSATSSGSGGESQDTTAGVLPSVGSNIQQAFRGLGALPFHKDFAEDSFDASQL
jgi:hypothetical protein